MATTPTFPAIILNNTVMDEYANSYADVAYADGYWEQHWDQVSAALWNNLPNDNVKAGLLVQACRSIEALRFTEPVDPLAEYQLSSTLRDKSAP